MKKVFMIMVAIAALAILIWIFKFIWELFWVVVAFSWLVYIVKKFK